MVASTIMAIFHGDFGQSGSRFLQTSRAAEIEMLSKLEIAKDLCSNRNLEYCDTDKPDSPEATVIEWRSVSSISIIK